MRPDDNRYIAELPAGIIKNPKLMTAGVDLYVNDVVYTSGGIVYPVYGHTCKPIDGIIAANGIKGHPVLVAVTE